ncbi:hypothetical protein cypCar_00001190 [Cyprinus carpio]|nr:hypothetical protein cypCar_00001190 [Cyprinus carpio]
MAAVGTWSFSRPAVERMRCMLLAGQNATDVVETAMADNNSAFLLHSKRYIFLEVEDDGDTGRHIVGRGGYPNLKGVVECDAAIMEGVPGRFGAVAALRGIAQPCRVARKEYLEKNKPVRGGHDTIGLIALDLSGNITVGVSTSGAPFKSPGRVGDSPLPGCGLYADHTVGAAAATGDGDKIMCYCPSFHVVQLMRQGEVGAASSVEFPHTFWSQGLSSVEELVINQQKSINV